jgi:drug/metabolite transporter (DMT)-like permease
MTTPAQAGHPGLADYGLLFGLSLLWGSSFYAIKVAVDHGMPPMTLASLRVGIGAVVLLSIARLLDQKPPSIQGRGGIKLWLRILLLGVIGNSLPFFLIAAGEQTTTSQLAGILMATIPILVFILAHFFVPDERLTLVRLIGVLLGFAGMIVLVGIDALKGLGEQVMGQLLIIGGCISYSLYGVNAKRLPKLPPQMLIGVILAAGFFAMLPFWFVLDRPWSLAWDWRVAVGFASLNNYIVPLMALGWGYFLLGEQPHLNALVALVLILAGLALPRLAARRRPS